MHSTLCKVALHGVPRSGTSWLGEIFNSSPHTIYRFQPLFSYALKDFLTERSSKAEIEEFFHRIAETDDSFILQSDKRQNGEFPRFEKTRATHIVYKEVRYMNVLSNMLKQAEDVFLCAVIRNPLSVISSWLRAPREFRCDLDWTASEEWRYAPKKNLDRPEEFNGYEKWKEATRIFHRLRELYPDRVHIVKYATLLNNPLAESQRLFQAIGLSMTESTIKFLAASSNTSNSQPYSVFRKGQRDDQWKQSLAPSITAQIQADLKGSTFEQYLES